MVLVDSSIWIGLQSVGFDDLLDGEEPAVCLPIIQEVLQGARSEWEYRGLRQIFRTMIVLESPMSSDVYDEAVNIYRTARARGFTIRSMNDCLIAACAIRNDVLVVHHDRDYARLGLVTGLRQRNLAN